MLNDISVTRVDAKFVDKCNDFLRPCWFLGGTGTLNNSCAFPVGVQLKLTGYDENNIPVDIKEFWPASIRNIPIGEYNFKMPKSFDYSVDITRFSIEVVDIKVW